MFDSHGLVSMFLFLIICFEWPYLPCSAEVVPGLEPPKTPSPSQNKPPQNPPSKSSDSEDHSPASDSGISANADSRQDSHKHASTSGRDGTASNSVSRNGSDSSSSKQSDQDGSEQRSDSKGDGKSGLADGTRSEKVKHAVSIAGNKMRQAVQEEGNGTASRYVKTSSSLILYTSASLELSYGIFLHWRAEMSLVSRISP